MSACHSTRKHSLLKTMLGKIRDRYQTYCTTYKRHAMATCQRGAGCPLDRGIDLYAEDPEPTDIDNESTHSSDATVALGGPEAEGHPKDPVFSNHDKLTALMREINDLHQWVEAGEGQSAVSLDCIEYELQNLYNTSSTNSTHTYWLMYWPSEKWYDTTQTPCAPCRSKQIWQTHYCRIYLFFNEHNSTKLEELLRDMETAADLTNESRAKLAKVKSRWLTHTLVTEAINSDKSWD